MALKNKNAQEEMIGFIVIILIVAVIGLIALFFLLKSSPDNISKSLEAENFLSASMQYTTECSISTQYSFLDLRSLIKECYRQRDCNNNKPSCQVMNETLFSILLQSFPVSENTPLKGYTYHIAYTHEENKEELLFLASGNCTNSQLSSAETLTPVSPGTISTSLTLCY